MPDLKVLKVIETVHHNNYVYYLEIPHSFWPWSSRKEILRSASPCYKPQVEMEAHNWLSSNKPELAHCLIKIVGK